MKNRNHRRAGFTLVEIMVVVAIIALLAAIAIPNFVNARAASQRTACIANMKQIEGAKGTWAIELKKSSSASPDDGQLFGANRYIRQKPACPAGGAYTIDLVGNEASCTLGTAEGHTL
jgi:prepilin-type N-terminal cleavage/methylation domain-containing protein